MEKFFKGFEKLTQIENKEKSSIGKVKQDCDPDCCYPMADCRPDCAPSGGSDCRPEGCKPIEGDDSSERNTFTPKI